MNHAETMPWHRRQREQIIFHRLILNKLNALIIETMRMFNGKSIKIMMIFISCVCVCVCLCVCVYFVIKLLNFHHLLTARTWRLNMKHRHVQTFDTSTMNPFIDRFIGNCENIGISFLNVGDFTISLSLFMCLFVYSVSLKVKFTSFNGHVHKQRYQYTWKSQINFSFFLFVNFFLERQSKFTSDKSVQCSPLRRISKKK